MKVLDIVIENFMSIGYDESGFTMELDKTGLVNIIGKNLDDSSAGSNGSGKSSIAEAICWGLFGKTAKGVSGDEVVNKLTKNGTSVTIYLENEHGDVYKIIRTRKHKTGGSKLSLSKGVIDLTLSSIKETQERIDKLLGMNYEIFRSSHYMGQEDMPDLPNMTDKELKELLEKAANITDLELAYAEAKEVNKGTVGDLIEKIKEFNITWANYRIRQKDYHYYTVLRDNFEERKKEDLIKVDNEIAELRGQHSDQQMNLTILETKASEEMLEEVETKIELTSEHATAVADVEIYSNDLRIHKITTSALKAKKEKLKKDIEDLATSKCGSCGEPLNEEKKGKLQIALDLQKASLKKEVLKLCNEIKKSKEALKAAEIKRDSTVHTNISVLTDEKAEITGNLREIKFKKSDLKRIEADLESTLKEQKNISESKNIYGSEQTEALIKFDAAKVDVMDRISRIRYQKHQCELTKIAVDVFSPAGIRGMIIDDVVPFLNGRIEYYLTELSDGNITAGLSTLSETKKGEIREKIIVEIETKSGVENFNLLSGGEKRKVRLACGLALQDLVQARAESSLDIYIADEIDDALDTDGLERLMGILEDKGRDKGSVLVISHNSLSDWIRNSITVEKKDGISTITL